ncbi:MAG: hypothetical protein IBX58_15920 [Roseovarius sp.]|nr:hypothetical protein [Roseovarius sp.]
MAGLDLMDLAGKPTPEMTLMRESVEGACAMLEFMRLAFGHAGAGETCDGARLHALLGAHIATRPRLALDWAVEGALTRVAAQQLALALLCALHALPRGGTLRVAREGPLLRLAATGQIATDPALWDGLAGRAPPPAPDPRRIEFALLSRALAGHDCPISVTLGPDMLLLTLPQGKDD